MPNSDTGGRVIFDMINNFVKLNQQNAVSFVSVGQSNYLSIMKRVDLVIGNSSSGIIEAPFFKIPTINLGDRQKGRIQGETIINSILKTDHIIKSINIGLSDEFKNKIKNSQNPYGNENASKKILDVLSKVDLKQLINKNFYDLKSSDLNNKL
jgi:GDP/UDP-N,N'-diacetylbacillosamine 2-epimerase (hydrolysing)